MLCPLQACPGEGRGHSGDLGHPRSGQLGFTAPGDLLAAMVVEGGPREGPLCLHLVSVWSETSDGLSREEPSPREV